MTRALVIVSLLACVGCATPDDGGRSTESGSTVVPPCKVGGCSGQVCSDRSDIITTCEWIPEYACYRSARCEPQADGVCAWTQTPELVACIQAARRQ